MDREQSSAAGAMWHENNLSTPDEPHPTSNPDPVHVRGVGSDGVAGGMGLESFWASGNYPKHATPLIGQKPPLPWRGWLAERMNALGVQVDALETLVKVAMASVDTLYAEQQRLLRLLGDDAATKVDLAHAPNAEEDTGGERRST